MGELKGVYKADGTKVELHEFDMRKIRPIKQLSAGVLVSEQSRNLEQEHFYMW